MTNTSKLYTEITGKSIYEQHDAAFKYVQAYVILKDGERVATIAFKFPKDGAGRLYAYVHWIGTQMQRGNANGYGYDKRSAAVENAIAQLHDREKAKNKNLFNFTQALLNIGGSNWDRALENAGFTVYQAV